MKKKENYNYYLKGDIHGEWVSLEHYMEMPRGIDVLNAMKAWKVKEAKLWQNLPVKSPYAKRKHMETYQIL